VHIAISKASNSSQAEENSHFKGLIDETKELSQKLRLTASGFSIHPID
jgi:hypothetical protein